MCSEKQSERTGRVLRVKSGYNPNSSSVGSDIPTFLALAAGGGTAAVIILNIIAAARDRIAGERRDEETKEDDADA